MRASRLPLLFVTAALFAVLLPPVAARSTGMHRVADVKGRFSISFPAQWKVVTSPGDTPAVIGADLQSDLPHLNVNVVVEPLSEPLSPAEYARISKPLMAATFHEFAVIREGPARIAHRESFYRYFTWEQNLRTSLYQVQAYFTAGRLGFVLTGTTANDPERVRTDIPVISQIFETFTPNLKKVRAKLSPGP